MDYHPARMRFRGLFAAFGVVVLVALTAVVHTQAPPPGKRLLFLTHAGLYKHPSLEPAEAAVTAWGKGAGFEVTTRQGFREDAKTLDMSFLTPEYLASLDGLMLMTNGNLPFTDAQKRGIVEFVRGGKALVGVHCATLTMYDYPEFGEVLGGYYLRSLIPTAAVTAGKVAVLKVEDQAHPATRMLGSTWPLNEEFYEFGRTVWDASRPTENVSQVGRLPILLPFSRDRVHVLLSLDTDRTVLSDLQNVPKGDYPQAWTRTFGRGRTFYTALGHREDIWAHDAVFRAHVTGGIRWALGLEN
jgi:type 1 glutamine amidotransferase